VFIARRSCGFAWREPTPTRTNLGGFAIPTHESTPRAAIARAKANPFLAKTALVGVALAAMIHIALAAAVIGRTFHPYGLDAPATFAAAAGSASS